MTIVEGLDSITDDPTNSETFGVERVLKGSLPPFVTLAPAWTSLCHDTVAYFGGPEGSSIVVAIDLAWYDDVIHPMWTFDSQGINAGTAGSPPGVMTLRGLESAILAELGFADTETFRPEPPTAVLLLLAVVVVLVVLSAVARRRIRGAA